MNHHVSQFLQFVFQVRKDIVYHLGTQLIIIRLLFLLLDVCLSFIYKRARIVYLLRYSCTTCTCVLRSFLEHFVTYYRVCQFVCFVRNDPSGMPNIKKLTVENVHTELALVI